MLIYQNSTQDFISDVRENLLADKMKESFEESFGKRVNPSEFRSWENSLRMMRDVIELAELYDNNIALEYTIPYNQSRLDCLLFGRNQESEDNIALIELKQWDSAEAIIKPKNGAFLCAPHFFKREAKSSIPDWA